MLAVNIAVLLADITQSGFKAYPAFLVYLNLCLGFATIADAQTKNNLSKHPLTDYMIMCVNPLYTIKVHRRWEARKAVIEDYWHSKKFVCSTLFSDSLSELARFRDSTPSQREIELRGRGSALISMMIISSQISKLRDKDDA